jgi:uncharacterized protein YbjQ (UPF0145 family)
MIAVIAGPSVEGYRISQYKGTAQGATFGELLRHAANLGAKAVLNTCYDDALDIDTLYHGAAVVIDPIQRSVPTNVHRSGRGLPDTAQRAKGL